MYYPKSEITSNLYTSTGEFIYKETHQTYRGPYYATTDGKYYTGKDYSPQAREIVKLTIKDRGNLSKITGQYYPTPTEKDYEAGYIYRYFSKRVNGDVYSIRELSKEDSKRLEQNPLYLVKEIKWKISGDGSDNKNVINSLKKEIPGVENFLTNIRQYIK
jgi:hypothetical protein